MLLSSLSISPIEGNQANSAKQKANEMPTVVQVRQHQLRRNERVVYVYLAGRSKLVLLLAMFTSLGSLRALTSSRLRCDFFLMKSRKQLHSSSCLPYGLSISLLAGQQLQVRRHQVNANKPLN